MAAFITPQSRQRIPPARPLPRQDHDEVCGFILRKSAEEVTGRTGVAGVISDGEARAARERRAVNHDFRGMGAVVCLPPPPAVLAPFSRSARARNRDIRLPPASPPPSLSSPFRPPASSRIPRSANTLCPLFALSTLLAVFNISPDLRVKLPRARVSPFFRRGN